MNHRPGVLLGVLALLLTIGPASATEPALPASLELTYALRFGGMTVGHVTRTLTREADGRYRHQSRSRPEGMARMFTSVEWFEEGYFDVQRDEVRPLSFLEYRVGADKPHRHSASFDWVQKKIDYVGWPSVPLPPGTQDLGSILYALMLNPPATGGRQDIHISSGKKLRAYRYAQVGGETLKTALGEIPTSVIDRLPLEQDKDREGFRVWLASGHRNLPVRIVTSKRGKDTVLELESVSGLQ